MTSIKRGWIVAAAVVVTAAGLQLISAPPAPADPQVQPQPQLQPAPAAEVLHNITYRARVDGVSRGATITYSGEGDQTQTANPTMVPGRVFEANSVLGASKTASMRVSIQWPYSANLHCEILVDDQLAAQADDFIAPRLLPDKEDPDYGALTCEAPVGSVGAPAEPTAPAGSAPPPPSA